MQNNDRRHLVDLEMEKLLKEVLKEITPTEEEHVEEHKLVEDISRRLRKFDVTPILVGSLAKGTDIRNNKDIDIFIMFPEDTSREELEKRGLEIGKKVFSELRIPFEIDYAEHPYICGTYGKHLIEIVPCYDTKEMKSAVDRTPYHTHYVKKKLSRDPPMRDNIRLLKQFMKGADVYGAEEKVRGFSGYLAELLVINYGSFEKVLKAAADWRFGQVLDPENLWKDNGAIGYFFKGADLIIVDPVDKDRNAAAAVSKQKLSEYIVAAREFLKGPDRRFFFQDDSHAPDRKALKKKMGDRGTRLIALEFTHQVINPNMLYSQLRKTQDAVGKKIEEQNFKVLKSEIWTDEKNTSVIIFDMEIFSLPQVRQHIGPPIDQALKEQEKFLEKYKKYIPYIKEDRWVADIKRNHTEIEQLFPEIIKNRSGFGKNLRDLPDVKMVSGVELLKTKSLELLKMLDRLLTPI
jgi:tRNA nucleotidyltransferase (CCA-adding enzyme)